MHVVVVGAGIAGLAAAHAVRRAAPEATVTVLDGAGQIGGKLRTSEVGGVAVDEGAEAFVLRAPEGQALAREVGLAAQLVTPATSSANVVVRGALRPLPGGTLLGIPTDPAPIAESLGDEAAEAVRAEPSLPGDPLTDDVAVGAVVRRRLGDAFADSLVDPLLGGVYAGHADQLSLRATMPAIADRLAADPSLVRAATAVLDAARGAGGPVFGSLREGMGALPEAVLRASGAELRLGLPVREVLPAPGGFRVIAGPVPAPTMLEADGVIVAAPAPKAASMLRAAAPSAAYELSQIEYASLAIVTLVYPQSPLPAGSGVLVPSTEGRTVKALTFSSQKWAHLAGGGQLVVRASIGRHSEEQVLHRDDADLASAAARDVAELTGLAAQPIATRVTRWGGALPQYAVGHTDRVRRIVAAVAEVPGLAVCGAAYGGVGIPACIRSGQEAAASVLASLREHRGGLQDGATGLRESTT